MKNNKTPSRLNRLLSKERVDKISLAIAILSLAATVIIGISAYEIAKRSQPLEYSVTTPESLRAYSYADKMYTTGGIDFKQLKPSASGDYSSVFLGSISDGEADIVHIPRERNARFDFSYETENGLIFYMSDEFPNELIFSPTDMSAFEAKANTPGAFHLIFKGYNREYTIYSVVYFFDEELTSESATINGKPESLLTGKISCYVIDEDIIYEPKVYQQIAEDLGNNSQYTADSIFESIIHERKLCYDRMSLSH